LDEEGALFDSGFDGDGPFRVTPEAGGVSLESALRDYGPAALDDLIPRLREIARELDAAHAAGFVHGALHPSKVIVHDDATSLIKGSVPIAPYAAPEMAEGAATPASDQFGLAAIAYEWLFGRPIDRPADRPVEVRTMPGVDRVTLSKAFSRALAPSPAARFASCNDFCSAISAAALPELPFDSQRAGAVLAVPADDEDPVEPFLPESADGTIDPVGETSLRAPDAPEAFDAERDAAFVAQDTAGVDDLKIVAEESILTASQPDIDAITPLRAEAPPTPVTSWDPAVSSSASRKMEPQRFGAMALFLAVIVGAIFGFAAGYMARPRALQNGAPAQIAVAPGAEAPVESAPAAAPPEKKTAEAPAGTAPKAPAATPAPAAPRAPEKIGRLLVRSTPSGASVSVDGVDRGVTPLALRELETGTLSVIVARRGYIPETRRVVITKARPARTLDVRLATAAAAPATTKPAPRPSTPATLGRPAATTGSLNVDSRPIGAAVTIDGKPSGNTPVTITDLPPGEYRIVMTMPGFRNFATTVRVVAGERVRAAASLTAQEQE
jgi:hypothetical protein